MFRAGTGSKFEKAARKSTPITVPLEGGRSQDERTFDPSNRSSQDRRRQNDHSGASRGWSGSGNYASGRGGGYRGNQYSSSSSQDRNWSSRGREGFETSGGHAGRVGEGYRTDSFNQLERELPHRSTSNLDSPESQRRKALIQERATSDFPMDKKKRLAQEKERERVEKEEQAELKRRKDEETKLLDQKRFDQANEEDRQRRAAKKQQLNSLPAAARSSSIPSTSGSSSALASTSKIAKTKVTDQYTRKPAVDLKTANAKSSAFLAALGNHEPEALDDAKNVDSEDDLMVVTMPVSRKDKGKERDAGPSSSKIGGGKGKERAKEADEERPPFKTQKKTSNLSKLKKRDPLESPPPSPERKKQSDSSRTLSSSESKKASKTGLSLSQQYKQKQAEGEDADEIDLAIKAADEKAKREKRAENGDSDIEVVDPLERGKADDDDELGSIVDFEDSEDAGREETPDALLEDEDDEVDPDTLCPFCDQTLPEHPSDRLNMLKGYLLERPHIEPRLSTRNSKAKYLPIVEIASFCQLHKVEKTVIPEGVKRGYPLKISWKALPRRIENEIAPRLSQIILGEVSSRFVDRAKRDWEKNNGFKRTNVTAEWDSFHFEEPGYYGPRGFESIHATLRQLFTVDNPMLTPSNISPFTADFYLRRVLVPETALELIRLDLKLERTAEGLASAAEVLEKSRAFGKAAHGIVENVEKERVRAQEEEKRKEEARDQERKDKAERDRKEREDAERKEAEEEEQRIAAETPQYRQPKALAKLQQPAPLPLGTPATAPSSSSSSSSSSTRTSKKERQESSDPDEAPVVAAQKAKTDPPAKSKSTPLLSQPGIAAFMKKQNLTEGDLEGKDQAAKPTSTKPSSSSSSSKGKTKEALVIDDSSSSSDGDRINTSVKKKKKRRHSSPEKPRREASSSPDKKRRRASSPSGQSPKKKSKSTAPSSNPRRAPSPIKDQTNALARALAASDLESDVETNFKDKNRKLDEKEKKRKRDVANEMRKRTLEEKKRLKAIEEEEEQRMRAKGKRKDKDGGAKGKEKKLKRRRLAADSSDSD